MHRTISRRSLLICGMLAAMACGAPLLARDDHIRFERLGVDDGLPQNSVPCIYQDSQGYMWFGTLDGLARYDGYEFIVYKEDPLRPNSLSYNSISTLYEDRSGLLWIGTDGHLNHLDLRDPRISYPKQAHFTRYSDRDAYGALFTIGAIGEDTAGNIWIGSHDRGLFKLERRTHDLVHYRFGPDVPPYKVDKIEDIHVEVDNASSTFWMATMAGLVRFDVQTGEHTQYRNDPDDPKSLSHDHVRSVCGDGAGGLWIGTYGGGVNRLVRVHGQKGEERIEFIRHRHDPQNPNSLSSDLVRSVFYDHESKTLWIGTDGGGLNKFDVTARRFNRYQHRPDDRHSISSDDILYVYRDRWGTFWVGTNGGGVNKFNTDRITFRYHHEFAHMDTLGSHKVWAIYEDASGTLWLGTDRGLRAYQRNDGDPADGRGSAAQAPILVNHQVQAIHEDAQGHFWLGTLYDGLARWDRQTGTVTWFKHDPANPKSLASNFVYSIHRDREGTLWIGTNGGGLCKLLPALTNHQNARGNRDELKDAQFQSYSVNTHSPATHGWVTDIHEDDDGVLWLGTWGTGLVRFDKTTEKMTHFVPDTTKPSSLNVHSVMVIHEDADGVLWLGTYGGGLNRFVPRTGQFRHYTERDGLANNVIYGILEGQFGCLWLSTNQGLSRFNPKTETFKNYDVSDGLQSNEFNVGAYFKSPRGELFFGGVNGFNSFYPKEDINPHPPQVVLAAFNKFGKPVHFDAPLSELENIDLSYDDTFFSFEFVALHYKDPEDNQYVYKMDGFDRDWNYVGNRRQAIYTNLDPGEYTFRVKAANSDGVWNEAGVAVAIEIASPFWKTAWFIASCGFMLALVIWGAYKLRVRQLLAVERARARERQALVQDFHDEMGQTIASIAALARDLRDRAADLPDNCLDALNRIGKHAERLIREMSVFVQEHGPEEGSVYDLAVQVKEIGDEIFDPDQVDFQLVGVSEVLEQVPLPLTWRQQLRKIFQEAMANIVKHSQDCQNVTLRFHLRAGVLRITLTDDGQGFDPGAVSGSGQGLANMQARAAELRGKLEVRSRPGGDTQVRFIGRLP